MPWPIPSPLSIFASETIPVRIVSDAPADDPPDTQLLEIALAAHGEAYKELTQSWRAIETKAQGTVALAGIFMAAAFAFVRDVPEDVGRATLVLFGVAVVLLTFSAIGAVWAQRVRTIPASPSLLVHRWIEAIRKLPTEEQAARLPGFYEEYNDAWVTTNGKLMDLIRSKARSVMIAQMALLIAGACVSAATLITLLTPQPVAQEEVHANVP